MPLYLWELFTPGELSRAVMDGYIRQQTHPTLPYTILNYTEKAVFDKHWTPVTLNCRGLIIDNDFEVIARPYPKFFNHSEHENDVLGHLPKLDPSKRVIVTDKMDGSLGILYPTPDGYAIATRGSFTSPQALHATEIWRQRYSHTLHVHLRLPSPTTWLFEIVYPDNRIVCDYEDLDDLVLLGAVDIETGRITSPKWMSYSGPKTEVFSYATLADALAAEPRPGAEGLVVRFTDDDTMVKIKQEDYIILHRLVTGLSKRTVWEALGSGQSAREICLPLPDEFHGWVHEVAAELLEQRDAILSAAAEEYERISDLYVATSLMGREYRAAWAREAVRSEYRAWLFMLLDGKDPSAKIWDTLKPEAFQTPFNGEEKDS